MKKHFLLLMMAFFSLAGWAQTYDLSEGAWTIKFYASQEAYALDNTDVINTATYTGGIVAPYIVLNQGTTWLTPDKFNAQWNNDPIDVKSEGYTVTISSDMTHTFGTLTNATKKFYVMKASSAFSQVPVVVDGPLAFNGSAQALIKETPEPAAAVTGAIASVLPTIMYQINDGEWSAEIPTATNPGTYTVSYKIAGTDNYNGTDAVALTAVTLNGTAITDYTAPTGIAGLAFRWNNTTSEAIPQALVNAGSVDAAKGTMYYSYKFGTGEFSEWSTTVPTGSQAGSYTIKWKITGANGYADVAGATLAAVEIAKVTPTVTAATGATTLAYTTAAQALLTAEGSATFGATSALKYQIRYKATEAGAYGAYSANTAYADVKGTNPGFYEIKTLVPDGGNYNEAAAAATTVVTITKPSIFTAVPTAKDLTWNTEEQVLIEATVKEDGIAKYYVSTTAKTDADLAALADGDWKEITAIKKSDAGTYYVYYKVADGGNYQAVAPTQVPNVKIKKKVLSVKVNDVTKDYDGGVVIAAPAAGKFTFVTRIESDATLTANFNAVAYSAIDESNKVAGTHEGVVTVTEAALNAVTTNYEYTIIPGNLIINKKAITVVANAGLTTVYGTPLDISDKYTVTGKVGTETNADVFTTLPVLTSNAAATNPAPGTYDLSFTKGTLKADGNYQMSTEGENNDGYKIDGRKFTVTADPDKKLVITVLPHTQQYTGVAESWDNMVEGVDYAVSGLISGDAIVTAPTFSRSDATNYNVGTYDLTATIDENTIVADKTKYPGGIIVNNSTFQIKPKVLTATIPQQVVLKDASTLPDATAWSVTGLQNGEEKSVLNGVLSLNHATNATGTFDDGIKLTIEAGNYAFDEAGTLVAYGKLQVISADQFVLDPADAALNDKIQAAGSGDYNVQFNDMSMNGGEWYAYVFPVEVSLVDLVTKLNTYVVVNTLKSSTMDEAGEVTVKFAVEMNKIPAGVPFLIKPAADKNWNVITGTNTFAGKIAKTITDVVTEKATLTGTYEVGTVKWGYELDGTTADADAKYRWLAHKEYKGDNNWKNPKSNAHTLAPMEAYLVLDKAATKARILVEDLDENGTTAIKSLSVDDVNGLNVKGWYTVGGMKLQGAPTQKGIYIKDGKKVIIK